MRKIKVLFLTFLILLFSFLTFSSVSAKEENLVEPLKIYFFWQQGCPHCAKEKVFLKNLEESDSRIKVDYLELRADNQIPALISKAKQKLGVKGNGVPFTVIGEQSILGWYDDEVTGEPLKKAIEYSLQNSSSDIIQEILSNEDKDTILDNGSPTSSEVMNLPIFGEVDIKKMSLPLITIVLGVLDGFNPCAMWVLMFLIMLLLRIEEKRRRWTLGIIFIAASSFVYFLFMAAWLNLILFLGLVFWVRFLIGLLAIGGGSYNLKEYFSNPNGGCKITGDKKRRKVFDKLEKIIQEKSFLLAIGGIIMLAFAVNLVELVCSAGLPAIYTQVLAISSLSVWQYYAYILLYIFFFMLDDMVIFFIAMATLQMTGMTTKYSRYSHLVGGVLMILIGLLLIFRPDILMFS